jgi:hypothetical protein
MTQSSLLCQTHDYLADADGSERLAKWSMVPNEDCR